LLLPHGADHAHHVRLFHQVQLQPPNPKPQTPNPNPPPPTRIRWWTEGKFGLSQSGNLAIYSYLVAAFIVGLVLRDFFFFRFSVLSAAQMRKDLSAAIMQVGADRLWLLLLLLLLLLMLVFSSPYAQAPMMFFMTENLGPLTGVFTR